ncbi:hypothetical protein [uncultured Roseobacter sp.]|uniref:hypothetical protein n=1 Tax=uncultured Roseobacter sp. TaxID=114847 RepID=UPI002616CE48|nr:hypothetical protein [uncultured Roseobacter sp.]
MLEQALTDALTQYEETMGEAFPVVPRLVVVADTAFWAAAELEGEALVISVSTGIVDTLSDLWGRAFADDDFCNGVGQPIESTASEMIYLGLIWLLLHELHHYQMGHFAFTGRLSLTEANAPKSYGIATRENAQLATLHAIAPNDWALVEPCLEMQADHDAMEMLLDAYSPDGWKLIRNRAAAIAAIMMLIEREEAKRRVEHVSHPKAATRIFQLLGHVMEMPLIQSILAQQRPDLNIDPTLPTDDEQGRFNREVVIPCFFDAVNLARIAAAETIRSDLGEAQDFIGDMQTAKLADPSQFDQFVTVGAKQWGELIAVNSLITREYR